MAGVRGLALAAHRFDRAEKISELVDATAALAHELLGAQSIAVSRIEQDTCRTLSVYPPLAEDVAIGSGTGPTRVTVRSADRPALRVLIREHSSWVAHAPDGSGADWGDPVECEALRASGHVTGLASPIIVNGHVWGQILATRDVGQPLFEADDVAAAEVVAALTAGALARVDLDEQVRHLVADDPLTGLGNRRVADHAAEIALMSDLEMCVVMCDVDGLKRVNDEFGHDAGDDLLRAVADVLRRAQDQLPGTTTARLGGDEFCLVTIGLSRDEVKRTLARTIRKYPLANGAALSWGVASTADGRPEHARTLFRRADAAQYQAKRRRARAVHAEASSASAAAVTVDKLVAAGVGAILNAQSGLVPRLCALAAAATGAMGGAAWSVLRDAEDGGVVAVARGGMPSDDPGQVRTLAVASEPWVVEVETTAPEEGSAPFADALLLLLDLAVQGAS
ncbi:MAG: sensor domain-containing diguanylate cyclase [Cellulomonas sp.]|nr:sensor domain-containing diguanylate cyclase [Cellulomonas sp.]